jgi:hypothetical protein
MPIRAVLDETARVFATRVLAAWHAPELAEAARLERRCLVGPEDLLRGDPEESWQLATARIPGFAVLTPRQAPLPEVPFVYEDTEQPHLVELRRRYDIEGTLAGAASEYDAMLRFGAWMGTRWSHGYEPHLVPGGRLRFRVADAIAAGERGARFWCEIDAKATVQAASALGWPARLVSVCPEPHRPERRHAVAEVWSNQHDKWFVLDTDFNVTFEVDDVPLSAWELTHQGPSLLASGKLHLRRFAPDPRAVGAEYLVSLYRFVFVDMRNDWVSRRLSRGSPAGGDLATWWTARSDLKRVFTSKRKVDAPESFAWKVNTTRIHLHDLRREDSGWRLDVAVTAYAPYFESFWIQVNEGEWTELDSATRSLSLAAGTHGLRARVETVRDCLGPTTEVRFRLP